MDVLTYDELRSLEREEKGNVKITFLSDDFISRFNEYISDKQRIIDECDNNAIACKINERTINELKNARFSFKSLMECRVKKIFSQALLDYKLNSDPDFKGLLSFEARLYSSLINDLRSHFNCLVEAKLKKEDSFSVFKDDNILVRFVNDFPEFAWADFTLGPFRKGDVANLPGDVVSLLLSKEVIKVVNDEEY